MANREKGEIDVTVEGRAYTLVLDTNAMVALETLFSTPGHEVTFDQVLARVNAGSVRHIRAFVWAALRRHHAEITVDGAGDLIHAAGGLQAFSNQLLAMVGGTTADPKDIKALGGGGSGGSGAADANPPKAQPGKRRGTGGRSTATRAASV